MRAVRTLATIALSGAALLPGAAAFAQTYNAFQQFSLASNPHGAWSYISNGELLTAKVKKCNAIARDWCWTNGGTGFPGVAAAEANKSGAALQYADVTLPASYLDFDPEGVANVAFQWTAPAAASIRVIGNFLGVAHDQGSHEVAVLHNGVALKTFTISSYQHKDSFNLKLSVAAGDTITFISYTGNGGGALSTGLQARVIAQ